MAGISLWETKEQSWAAKCPVVPKELGNAQTRSKLPTFYLIGFPNPLTVKYIFVLSAVAMKGVVMKRGRKRQMSIIIVRTECIQ